MAEIHDPREATLVVAASDSLTKSADYRCDGTADEVQIQAAIDALPASGGRVLLLDGTFNIAQSTNVNIPSDTTLEGQGDTTILQKVGSDAGDKILNIPATTGSHRSDITIKNMKLDIQDPAVASNQIHGTYIDRLNIENVTVTAGLTNKKGKVYILHSTYVNIRNCNFIASSLQVSGEVTEGDDTTIDSTDILCSGCTFQDVGVTSIGNMSNRWRIIGNSIIRCAESGIDISYSPDAIITGNTFHTIAENAVYSQGGRKIVIADNVVVDANKGFTLENGLGIGSDVPGKVIINNNEIYNTTLQGISAIGVSKVSILGNQIIVCGSHGILLNLKTVNSTDFFSDECIIQGNYVFDFGNAGSSRGIYLLEADNCKIVDNVVDGDGGSDADYGISLNSECVDNVVRHNRIIGCDVLLLDDNGTGTMIDSIVVPFSNGSDPQDSGYEIDAAAEIATAFICLPLHVQQVLRMKIYARSVVTEADTMHMEYWMNGGADNEGYATHASHETNKNSTSSNFAADDVIFWTSTATGVKALTGGDSVEVKVTHEDAGNGDCETDAFFRTVEFEFV